MSPTASEEEFRLAEQAASEHEAFLREQWIAEFKSEGYRIVKLDLIDIGPGFAYLIDEEL